MTRPALCALGQAVACERLVTQEQTLAKLDGMTQTGRLRKLSAQAGSELAMF